MIKKTVYIYSCFKDTLKLFSLKFSSYRKIEWPTQGHMHVCQQTWIMVIKSELLMPITQVLDQYFSSL